MEKIIFTDQETGETTEFFCLEQTQINSTNYLLVTEDEEGDADAYILKETASGENESMYDMVEDEKELLAIGKVFAELMEDVEMEF